MYVYFRMIKVALLGLCKPPVKFLDTITTTMRVWPNDLDMNFHLNNGRYLTLMDIGRLDLTIRAGLIKAVFGKRWLPVLATASIQFYRSLAPFQSFQLTTQVVYWDEKWIYIAQNFQCDGKIYASALVKAVFKQGSETVPVHQLFAFLGTDFFLPEVPTEIQSLGNLEANMDLRRREAKRK